MRTNDSSRHRAYERRTELMKFFFSPRSHTFHHCTVFLLPYSPFLFANIIAKRINPALRFNRHGIEHRTRELVKRPGLYRASVICKRHATLRGRSLVDRSAAPHSTAKKSGHTPTSYDDFFFKRYCYLLLA